MTREGEIALPSCARRTRMVLALHDSATFLYKLGVFPAIVGLHNRLGGSMSDDEHFVVRDDRGRVVGTIESEYKYSSSGGGPWGLGGTIGLFFGSMFGVWLIGGIVLSIIIQIISKIFGVGGIGNSFSLGFNLSAIAGFVTAVVAVINVLRKKEERDTIFFQAGILLGLGALIAVVVWAFSSR